MIPLSHSLTLLPTPGSPICTWYILFFLLSLRAPPLFFACMCLEKIATAIHERECISACIRCRASMAGLSSWLLLLLGKKKNQFFENARQVHFVCSALIRLRGIRILQRVPFFSLVYMRSKQETYVGCHVEFVNSHRVVRDLINLSTLH